MLYLPSPEAHQVLIPDGIPTPALSKSCPTPHRLNQPPKLPCLVSCRCWRGSGSLHIRGTLISLSRVAGLWEKLVCQQALHPQYTYQKRRS